MKDLVQIINNATKHEQLEDLAKFYNSEFRNIIDKHGP